MSRSGETEAGREALTQTLLDRRQELIGQVARLEDDLRWLDGNVEPELLEEGQEQAMARVLERLDEHDRDEIAAIERALERIRRGRYGICEACNEPIPPARQKAVPTTALCRPCAEMREAFERP
jgi:RNA polymerase-binding transcription factor DksA